MKTQDEYEQMAEEQRKEQGPLMVAAIVLCGVVGIVLFAVCSLGVWLCGG